MTTAQTPVISNSLSQMTAAAMRGMGAIVFWEMSDTKITPSDLRNILAAEGIQISVPDIDPEGAVKRASRTWAMGRGNDRFRSDPVDIQDPNRVKICILHRQEEGTAGKKQAKWETIESVIFDLQTRTWTCSASTPEVQSFVALADDYLRFLDHNFIRPNVIQKRLAEMRSFSLKSSSGLWYVTQDQMDSLAALQRVVSAIGSSAMYVVHVGETSQSRDAIQNAARGALAETLAELEAKLDCWVSSNRKIRTDAIDTALAEFVDLVERADLYQEALQVRMEDLTFRINAARDRARQIIDGNLDAHSNPETKPLGKRALVVLEAVEAAFPAPATFTVKDLEEVLGVESGSGAVQTHLRDICRLGKAHRKGRDQTGAMIYALGPGDGSGPGEEEEKVEVDTDTEPQEEMALVPQKETVLVESAPVPATSTETVQTAPVVEETPGPVEPAPVVVEVETPVVQSVTIPTDEVLGEMDRDALRAFARNLRDTHGIEIPRASKMGRQDLAQAISALR